MAKQLKSVAELFKGSCRYNCVPSYSAATMKRIALTSSSCVSFLSFANPEKGDPNPGMFILLSYFFSGFRPTLLRRSARRAVDSLFRRFAVEVLVVGFRLGAGMVDDAVPMIRRRIERI